MRRSTRKICQQLAYHENEYAATRFPSEKISKYDQELYAISNTKMSPAMHRKLIAQLEKKYKRPVMKKTKKHRIGFWI